MQVWAGLFGIVAGIVIGLAGASGVDAHGDEGLRVGSSADGGGALAVAYDFGRITSVSFVVEIAGSSLYTADELAFSAPAADEPAASLYVLDAGTEVRVELTGVEPGKTAMKVRGTVLDAVGESVVLGTQGAAPPNGLDDQHPELQLLLALPAGAFGEGTISFRLTTSAGAYTASPSYTLRLSNGHLAPFALDGGAYDAESVGCQKVAGKAARGYTAARYQALAMCLDKIAVVEGRKVAGLDAANAEAAAASSCGDKMLAKITKAHDKARDAILGKCVVSGDLTPTSATAHLGLVECRVDELVSASYPGAQGLLAGFAAGGQPTDGHFPCLVPAPHE